MVSRLFLSGRRVIWVLLLVLLPITSMPLIRTLVGSSTVASPSLLPLAVLTVIWLAPFIIRGGRLPGQSLPLFCFALAAMAACAAVFFVDIPTLKTVSPLREEVKALITLGIGISFYLIAATYPSEQQGLRSSLRWINWGGAVMLLWCAAQAFFWFRFNRYPDWMRDFQDLLSIGPLYRQRVTGFAVEPSWLAHQLNMLYLPLWLAASVQRTTAHRYRLLGISFENLLLLSGVGMLVLSFSRAGLLAFFAAATLVFIQFNLWLARMVSEWLAKKFPGASARKRLVTVFVIGIMAIVYTAGLLGGLFVYSKTDPRMAAVFQISSWRDASFTVYANTLKFGERVVYWQAGWEIYNDHPLLGVGLGNAGYFFPDKLPAYATRLVEVRNLLYRSNDLLNIKNLWVRLLAETGITGLTFFLAWMFLCFASTWKLLKNTFPLARTLGMAGLFVLAGMIFEGFSIDSFAMPYYWISLGLMTAMTRICYSEQLEAVL